MNGYLISTPVVHGVCPRCGAPILRGLAEGYPARVDVRPVGRGAEIGALMTGRESFALCRSGELVTRDPSRIRGGLVGTGIFLGHRCPR